MYQPLNVRELPSTTIIIYLSGKYAASYRIIALVGAATNIQNAACNEAIYILTPFNQATAYYKLIPTNSFCLE